MKSNKFSWGNTDKSRMKNNVDQSMVEFMYTTAITVFADNLLA